MRKNNIKNMRKKIRKIEIKLLAITAMLEVVKDSCMYYDYANQEITLKAILSELYSVEEKISLMT